MTSLQNLLEEEQKLLDTISKNRKKSRDLLVENRKLRGQLKVVREEIVTIVTKEIDEKHKSLYQVVKDALGVIDSRYNKIYDLINKEDK